MFVAASDERRGDLIRAVPPQLRSAPTGSRHQVVEKFSHRDRLALQRLGPTKAARLILTKSNEDHPRPKLTYSKVGCIQKLPLDRVAEFRELLLDELTVVDEHRVENSPNIFDHDCARIGLADNPDRGGEEISFVVFTQLLSSL